MKKRLLSILLALCVVLTLLPGPVLAAGTVSGTCGENLTWTLDSDGTLTISGQGEMISSRNTSIRWFESDGVNRTNIKKVVIEPGVTSIGEYTFYECNNLTSVSIPSSVTSIEDAAFQHCSLTSVNIPSGVTSIGEAAFANCRSLTSVNIPSSTTSFGRSVFSACYNLADVYYGGSENEWAAFVSSIDTVSNGHMLNATIHYNSTGSESEPQEYKVYCGPGYPDGYEIFDVSLEKCVEKTASTTYNPQLAHMLIAMCDAVHSETDMSATLESFDFEYTQRIPGAYLTYSLGAKQVGDETLVLVVVRGTEGFGNDWLGWASNLLDSGTNDNGQHSGFSDAATSLYDNLDEFLNNQGLNFANSSNLKFVITGFSRGAAAANILAARLVDEGKENIYAYTFACPDTAVLTEAETNYGGSNPYKCIFNIGDAQDLVSWVPRGIWTKSGEDDGWGADSYWNKYGCSYWFSGDWSSCGKPDMDAHSEEAYLAYLRSENSVADYRTRVSAMAEADLSSLNMLGAFLESLWRNSLGLRLDAFLIHIFCPVDVEVYNSDHQLVGSVTDNIPAVIAEGKAYIYVEGEKKYLYLLANDDYSVNLTATGEGTMEYSIYRVDAGTLDEIEEKTFGNVALVNSKQMISSITVENKNGTETTEVKLYILDSDGEPEKEVLPDGNGTEVPIKTPDNPPVSCEHEYTAIVTAPTCTERGYTTHTCSKCGNNYTDSYTAALGHSYGAWTVTTPATSTTSGQQERVCTRCGDKQTNVIPATGDGGNNAPDYSSSNDNTPTYRIGVPTSFTGGSIYITPASASAGQRVTITVKPNSGYQLEKLTVTDSKNTELTLNDKGDGKYTFTMPSSKVTVDAAFQPVQIPETSWDNPFTDITEGDWYYEAVRFVQENGLMSGYGDSTFAPNANLSRAMLAQILYNKEGRPTVTGSNAFADVVEGAWYADAVTWAAVQGIVGGYGNGLFGPGDNITREQLAVMLWRYAGEPAATDKELHFTDADTASGYAVDALRWAVGNGIINGYSDGTLAPRGQATRAQVAQMLMNYLKK